MCVFLLHPPSSIGDDSAPGSTFVLAPSLPPPPPTTHLHIPSISLPLKESTQRRKWKRVMVPCRREEGWPTIRPCYTVACQCKNGLSLTSIQSKLQRAGRSSLQVLMPCSCTRRVSTESKWQMSTESVMHVSHRFHWVILHLYYIPHALLWRKYDFDYPALPIMQRVPTYCFVKCSLIFFWRLQQIKAYFTCTWLTWSSMNQELTVTTTKKPSTCKHLKTPIIPVVSLDAAYPIVSQCSGITDIQLYWQRAPVDVTAVHTSFIDAESHLIGSVLVYR